MFGGMGERAFLKGDSDLSSLQGVNEGGTSFLVVFASSRELGFGVFSTAVWTA